MSLLENLRKAVSGTRTDETWQKNDMAVESLSDKPGIWVVALTYVT